MMFRKPKPAPAPAVLRIEVVSPPEKPDDPLPLEFRQALGAARDSFMAEGGPRFDQLADAARKLDAAGRALAAVTRRQRQLDNEYRACAAGRNSHQLAAKLSDARAALDNEYAAAAKARAKADMEHVKAVGLAAAELRGRLEATATDLGGRDLLADPRVPRLITFMVSTFKENPPTPPALAVTDAATVEAVHPITFQNARVGVRGSGIYDEMKAGERRTIRQLGGIARVRMHLDTGVLVVVDPADPPLTPPAPLLADPAPETFDRPNLTPTTKLVVRPGRSLSYFTDDGQVKKQAGDTLTALDSGIPLPNLAAMCEAGLLAVATSAQAHVGDLHRAKREAVAGVVQRFPT